MVVASARNRDFEGKWYIALSVDHALKKLIRSGVQLWEIGSALDRAAVLRICAHDLDLALVECVLESGVGLPIGLNGRTVHIHPSDQEVRAAAAGYGTR